MVKLGHINYLNCIPVHGAIILGKVPFAGKIVSGTPTQLNKLLERGEIDISPSSSVELIKGYNILPNLSISGKVDVKSIILVTKKPLQDIKSGLFYVTSHSATSVLLLKVILREFYDINAKYIEFNPETRNLPSLIKDAEGVLYIGDAALKLKENKNLINNDLAEIWYKNTNLPFTFALWQISKSLTDLSVIKSIYKSLITSFNYFINNKEELAKSFSQNFEMSVKAILEYWDRLSFELNQSHIESLNLYFKLARKHGFIQKQPTINVMDL